MNYSAPRRDHPQLARPRECSQEDLISLWWSSRKVLVPTGIRADAFGQVLDAVTETDLRALPVPPVDAEGRPYPAAQIKGAFPVATQGGYRFATGDPDGDSPMWVRGADGRPFVLSFEDRDLAIEETVTYQLRVRAGGSGFTSGTFTSPVPPSPSGLAAWTSGGPTSWRDKLEERLGSTGAMVVIVLLGVLVAFLAFKVLKGSVRLLLSGVRRARGLS